MSKTTFVPVLNQAPEEVPVEKIVPFRTRGKSTTPEKVALNTERIREEGILGFAVGRWLPKDDPYKPGCFELFTFHNRLQACINLGYKTIPCLAIPASWTLEQCFAKYLRDNNAVDNQSTGWAVNAVEAGLAILETQYRKDYGAGWEARVLKRLAADMGYSVRAITMLRDMGYAIKAKKIAANIVRITVVKTAIYVYNRFLDRTLDGTKPISVLAQEHWIEKLGPKDPDDTERAARDTFPKRTASALPSKIVVKREAKTMDEDIAKLGNAALAFAKKWQAEDDEAVSPDMVDFIEVSLKAALKVVRGDDDEAETEDRRGIKVVKSTGTKGA